MNDKTFNNIMMNLFWEMMLLASGVRCLDYWETIIRVTGYAFILIGITMIVTTVVVPVLKSRS